MYDCVVGYDRPCVVRLCVGVAARVSVCVVRVCVGVSVCVCVCARVRADVWLCGRVGVWVCGCES